MTNPTQMPTTCHSSPGGSRSEQLENVAGQPFCRLTAVADMLALLHELGRSLDPVAVQAQVPPVTTVGRDAKSLLRYFDSLQSDSIRVVAH